MSFSARLGHFVLFVVLTIATLGVYPLYFMVSTTRENNQVLKEIRDLLSSPARVEARSAERGEL